MVLSNHGTIARLVVFDLEPEKLVNRVERFLVISDDVNSSTARRFHQIPVELIP